MTTMDGWYCAFNALNNFIDDYIENNDRAPSIEVIKGFIHGAMTGYKEGGKE